MSKSCQFREIRRNIRRKKNNGKKETAKQKSTKVEKTLESIGKLREKKANQTYDTQGNKIQNRK